MSALFLITIFGIFVMTQSTDYTKNRQMIQNIIKQMEILEESEDSDEDRLEIARNNWEVEGQTIPLIAGTKCIKRIIKQMEREGLKNFFTTQANVVLLTHSLCRFIFK